MNQTLKNTLRLTGVILLCLLIFLGSGYLYLSYQQGKNTRADADAQRVPYAPALPDSTGLLVTLPEGDGVFFYLNFSDRRAVVIFNDTHGGQTAADYGHTVDHTLKADYTAIAGLIDRVGGLELDFGDGLFRYTGVQIIEMVSIETDLAPLRRQIVTALLARIAETGMTRQDLVYLIENTETDLTVPECFAWPEHIASVCRNVQLIGFVED